MSTLKSNLSLPKDYRYIKKLICVLNEEISASDQCNSGRMLTQILSKQQQHSISINKLWKMIYCPAARLQLCVGNEAI